MEVEYNISEADYVASVKLAATLTRKQIYWLAGGGALLLLAGLFGPDQWKIMSNSGLVCGIVGYLVVLHLFLPLQAKRHYRSYKSIHIPLFITLSDVGFTIRTDHGQNELKWGKLLKWRESSNHILVYFAPKMFYMIPKRLAAAGFDLEQFRKELHAHLGKPL